MLAPFKLLLHESVTAFVLSRAPLPANGCGTLVEQTLLRASLLSVYVMLPN